MYASKASRIIPPGVDVNHFRPDPEARRPSADAGVLVEERHPAVD
jgi:hypothetical protein